MSRADAVPAPLLVLGGVLSVQFGGALAATLVEGTDIRVGGPALLSQAGAEPLSTDEWAQDGRIVLHVLVEG